MADYNQGAAILLQDGGQYIDVHDVDVVGRLVRDDDIRRVPAHHQAAKRQPHPFAPAQAGASLVPHRLREEEAVQAYLYLVLLQGGGVECSDLLQDGPVIADKGILLVQIGSPAKFRV